MLVPAAGFRLKQPKPPHKGNCPGALPAASATSDGRSEVIAVAVGGRARW